LKPGGKIILSTPFVFGIHDAPHDYFRYTKYGLRHLFKKFEEIDLIERCGFFWTILVLNSRLMVTKNKFHHIFGKLLTLISVIVSPIAFVLDKVLPNTITTGYVAVFKKK